jgi:hypothetical protein
MDIRLTRQMNVIVWKLTTSCSFIIKSLNLDYMDDHAKFVRKYIWKMRVPVNIKIFMWFLYRKVLLQNTA